MARTAPREREYCRRTAGPAARILSPSPNATDGASAPRGERRGLRVLTAGPGGGPAGSNPTSPLVFSPPDDARGFSPSFFRAAPIEGWEGRNMTMPTERNLARRRGGEEDRERRSRRVSQAVDAQRRLNMRRADDTRTTAPPVGPRDPRYAYLTDSHD